MIALEEVIENIKSKVKVQTKREDLFFTDVHDIHEGYWQGDFGIEIINDVPWNYRRKDITRLVPGSDDGGKHCLDSLDGIQVYVPPSWETDAESLKGPVLVVTKPRKILHLGSGLHGTIHLCPNKYSIRYQRMLVEETKKTKKITRARD